MAGASEREGRYPHPVGPQKHIIAGPAYWPTPALWSERAIFCSGCRSPVERGAARPVLPEEPELAFHLQEQLPLPWQYPAILIVAQQTGGGLSVWRWKHQIPK